MKKVVGTIGAITGIATVTAIALWLFGHEIAAVAIGAATATFALLLVITTTMAVTSWWTRETMQAGADLVLKAENNNDSWDAKKTHDIMTLARALLSMGGGSNQPALPLPSQDVETWTPLPKSYQDGEFTEIERGGDTRNKP